MIKYTFKKSLYLILFVFFLQFSLAYPLEFGEVGVSDSLELSISDEMIFWDFPAGGIAIITDFNYEITGPDSNEFYMCGFDWIFYPLNPLIEYTICIGFSPETVGYKQAEFTYYIDGTIILEGYINEDFYYFSDPEPLSGIGTISTIYDINNLIQDKYKLYPNYPNPFNPDKIGTTIRYFLPRYTEVKIQIYNLKGQLVETLVNEYKPAGYHTIGWNFPENSGMSSGIYFYKLSTQDKTFIKKMIMMR